MTEDLYHAASDTIPDIALFNQIKDLYILRLKGLKLGVIREIKAFLHLRNLHTDLGNAYDCVFDPFNRYGMWTEASPNLLVRSQFHALGYRKDEEMPQKERAMMDDHCRSQ